MIGQRLGFGQLNAQSAQALKEAPGLAMPGPPPLYAHFETACVEQNIGAVLKDEMLPLSKWLQKIFSDGLK